MKRHALAAGIASLSILLAACGSSSKTVDTASTPAPATATTSGAAQPASGGIEIASFAYSGTMTVKPGEKVTVTNKDSAAHTLTDMKTRLFDTGNIAGNGGTGTFTAPTKPGSYPFGCTYHGNMKGTLVVAG